MKLSPNLPENCPTTWAVLVSLFLVALFLVGCGGQEELEASQAALDVANNTVQQTKNTLATAEAQAFARATEVADVRTLLEAAEARADFEHGKIDKATGQLDRVNQELKETKATLKSVQAELDETKKELSETIAELDEVKFGADNLLNEAESALKRLDLAKSQRVAAELNERYPDSAQAIRAAEIVALVENGIAEKEAAEAERIATATSKMRSDTDEVRDVTFYKDKSTPQYYDVNSFHLYIGKKGNNVWLRLRIQYTGDDWLFIEKYTIRADDQRFDIDADYFDIERDNGFGAVWEWYDGLVDKRMISIIQAIIDSEKTVLRYEGKQYYSDRTITATEKQALQNVLDAFVALGGDLNNP